MKKLLTALLFISSLILFLACTEEEITPNNAGGKEGIGETIQDGGF